MTAESTASDTDDAVTGFSLSKMGVAIKKTRGVLPRSYASILRESMLLVGRRLVIVAFGMVLWLEDQRRSSGPVSSLATVKAKIHHLPERPARLFAE